MYNLLKNYVDRLKKEDIVNFAIKKNIPPEQCPEGGDFSL